MTGPGEAGPGLPEPARPGLRTFSLDGRRAPGLYLVGWLASIVGGSTILVVLLGQPTDLAGAVLLGLGTLILAIGLGAAAGSQAIERQADAVLDYRGPSPFLLFGATVALTLFVELVALAPMRALGIGAGSTVEALLNLLILNGSAIVLVALLVVGSGALTWRAMGVAGRTAEGRPIVPGLVRDLAAGIILGVPVLLLTAVLGALLIELLGTAPASPLPAAQTPFDAILNVVSGVLIAPLGEEIFYREFATTAWVQGMGARAGIVRGALLFAFAHVLTFNGTPPEALIAFLTRLPVGLALGWIFIRRGSLAASFGLHATFNAIPLVLVGLSLG